MDLSVKLEIYEGPLDLLLHLIKKNEVDIYDIPVALITNQYLQYLEAMQSLNIEYAGEFLLMAATLTQIKSKMLLPISVGEEDSEEEDPRMAIIRPLLEHMKLRDAAEALERRELLNRDVFLREYFVDEFEDTDDEELVPVSLFELIDSFRKVLLRIESGTDLEILIEYKTVEQRIGEVIELMKVGGEELFEDLFIEDHSRLELILTFLSLLELARIGLIRIFQHPSDLAITIYYTGDSGLAAVPDPDDMPDETEEDQF
ncbi:MAG: segregation/condensation protein A [Deltaproteobacteria bacterium]|nr:segregation/condensation protein A [Deltaproteobacteria bacterium]